MFKVLDGKTSGDYVARVEPSSEGGRKLAEYILQAIDGMEKYRRPLDCNSFYHYESPYPSYNAMKDRE